MADTNTSSEQKTVPCLSVFFADICLVFIAFPPGFPYNYSIFLIVPCGPLLFRRSLM